MTRTARLTPPLAVIFGLLLACRGTEGPTSPLRESTRLTAVGALADKGAANNQSNGNNGPGQGHEDTVVTVKRLTPLSTRITTMAWIGPAGGTISLAGTGVIVTFPAGAVPVRTLISVTAKPGNDVAYDFQPHLVFPVPVIIQQDLRNTSVQQNPALAPFLMGAYFESDLDKNFVDVKHTKVRVKELRPGTVNVQQRKFTFTVDHFSGYLMSSGRAADDS
ncbi:MAG TPA: hypothetical protein VF929_04605 [Gemmatimonadaceae bacterium]